MVGEPKMSGNELSTARIGKIGELAVMQDILKQGYHCYSPACDDAQVDLVLETGYSFKRIQVKTVSKLNKGTSVEVRMHKHRFKERVDILAIYFMPKDIIAYYPYNNELSISLALKVAGNNQEKGRDWFYKYELIPQITKE